MPLSQDFLTSAAFGRATEIVHFVTLLVDGDAEKRFGPTRLSELGSEAGRLLFAHGAASVVHDPEHGGTVEGLAAEASMEIIEETRNGHFEAEFRLARTDGRIDLRFPDGSTVVLTSLAHETGRHRESILAPGATFCGESGARYVTGHIIGSGGTAHVYEVRNQCGDAFAAKCLASDRFDLTDLQDRFQREVWHLQQAQNGNIIGYVDSAYGDEHQILVMELGKETLARRLLDGAPSRDTALAWLKEILAGVCHLHTQGLVHRDLTPKNIMFAEDGALKISDFGTVRDDGDVDLTSDVADVRLGSLIFISDQQRRDPHDVRPGDDVFSVGQIAYLLLTGHSPQGNPPPLAAFPGIPGPIAEVIERMRAYRREDRFKDASDALGALDRACSA